MTEQTQTSPPTSKRRDELLQIAAELFATKGFKNTTVRDIADAAGILSGSLYHHFDSKESMVDEILSSFQEELFGKYAEILAGSADPRAKLEEAVRVSFEAIDHHRDEVAIFQNDADYLGTFDRFGYLADRNQESRDVWLTCSARASAPARCAATSTSSWCTASSATRSGWRCAGTSPAASSATTTWPTST